MRALVKHAWPLWVAGAMSPSPKLGISGGGRGRAPPQGLYIPLSFCHSDICSHLLYEEKLSAGPEAWGMQGSAGEKGAVCMGKHTSTCKKCFHSGKCVLDPWEDKFPGSTGMQALLLPAPHPRQGVCHLWKPGFT